jgi:uncharacterized membrane protein YjjB (DUF3815 family)
VDTAIKIIVCTVGTIAFAITMRTPKFTLIYIAIGGFITASIDNILSPLTNDFLSCLIAMIVVGIYCEIIARIIKEPTTITLIPSIIPLLPGSSIYYTMLYAIGNDNEMMIYYAKKTIFAGLGIALGAVISSTLVKIFIRLKEH